MEEEARKAQALVRNFGEHNLSKNILLNIVTLTTGIVIFSCIRTRYKWLFQPRLQDHGALVNIPDTFFGWLNILKLDDREIEHLTGLEAFSFLRMVMMMFKICSVCFIISLFLLLPGYWIQYIEMERGAFSQVIDKEGKARPLDLLRYSTIFEMRECSRFLWCCWLCGYLFVAVATYYIRVTYSDILQKSIEVKTRNEIQNYTVMLGNLPKQLQSNRALNDFFEQMCGRRSVHSAISMQDCGDIIPLIESFDEFIKLRNPAHRPWLSKIRGQIGLKEEDIEQRLKVIRMTLSNCFNEIHSNKDKRRSSTGFVTFRSMMSASKISQKDAFLNVWSAPAPEPENIYFENLAVSSSARSIANAVIFFGLITLLGFWTVPMTWIQAKLRDSFRKEESDPYWVAMIKSSAPLTLVVCWILILPKVIWALSCLIPFLTLENHISYVVRWLSDALIVVVIFVNFTFNSWSEVAELFHVEKENQKQWFHRLITNLGHTIPRQSTFFIQYIIISGGYFQLLPLLQTAPLLKLLFGHYTNPGRFDFVMWYSFMLLVFNTAIMFSVHSPFILLAGCFYFITSYAIFLWQLLFFFQKSDNNCGALPSVYSRMYIGLVILGLTMIAAFSIKKGFWQAALTVPMLYMIYRVKENTGVQHEAFNRIPLDIAARVDRKRGFYRGPEPQVDAYGEPVVDRYPYDMVSILMDRHLLQEKAASRNSIVDDGK